MPTTIDDPFTPEALEARARHTDCPECEGNRPAPNDPQKPRVSYGDCPDPAAHE